MSDNKRRAVKAKDYFINRKKSDPVRPKAKTQGVALGKNVREKKEVAEETKRLTSGNYLATISGYTEDLKGLTSIGGIPCEVFGAIDGEREEIAVDKKTEDLISAHFVSCERPSPVRVKAECPYFGICGNCAVSHMSREGQSALKKSVVEKCVPGSYGKVSDVVTGADREYRNKVHLAFGEENNKLYAGFFSETGNHVVPADRCPLHGKWYADFRNIVVKWARSFNLHAYKPWSGKGLLRFAAARYDNGNLLATIVATSGKISGLERLYRALCEKFGKVGLYVSENKGKLPDVMSGDLRHVAGEETLKGELLGVSYELSPRSFFQVNEEVAAKAYSDILNEISASEESRVIDCFSGIGVTSVLFARSGKEVTSIEIEKDAVSDATKIAAETGAGGRIRAIAGDVFKVLPKIGNGKDSVFFVDPPRKGLGEGVCRLLVGFGPSKIVYLSCNPVTLGEDVKRLTKAGYVLSYVRPYDFFPQTRHIESLAVLKREG